MPAQPTLFIVDDNDAVRDALMLLGGILGLDTEVYASAQAFLDAYEPGRTGCLVLDVRMPGMSGLELQEELVGRGARVAIVVITGHGTPQEIKRALDAGAVDVLEKPFDTQTLIARIQQAIARSTAAPTAP